MTFNISFTGVFVTFDISFEIKFIGLDKRKFYKDKFCNFYNLVAFDLIKFVILQSKLCFLQNRNFKSYFCFAKTAFFHKIFQK